MSNIQYIDEVLRAHSKLLPGGPGAPLIENGNRVGNSLLRAATTLISATLQTTIETAFEAVVPLTFDHFSEEESKRYFDEAKKGWGNPNPTNVRRLFFRVGFADVFEGFSWQKCPQTEVVRVLDEINQVRNRIAHGQALTVNGNAFRLTKPTVVRWRNYTEVFMDRFQRFIVSQFEE